MARNAEKAMTTLARWRAAQLGEDPKKKRRPYLASECRDVGSCQKWRLQVIREIAKKVSQIQNAGLGEFRIRDLNDEINKLLREKGHWEAQIRELGGPDHFRSGPRMLDHEGKEVPGNRGYKYFGAARQLPGVRELFEQAPPPPPHKTRSELMREIDATYYGYMDNDDGILIPLEAAEEEKAIDLAVEEWKKKKQKILAGVADDNDEDEEEEDDIYKITAVEESSDESDSELTAKSLEGFRAHVPVPSQREIQEAILQRRKQELLDKYASAMEEDDDEGANDVEEESKETRNDEERQE